MRARKMAGGAVLIVIGCLIMVMLLGNRDGKKTLPFGIYTVLTGSMSPTINTGSVVITKRADEGTLRAGDILTYATAGGDMLVTHRIVEVLSDGDRYSYITKGDANNADDLTPVPHARVVGRVVFWISGLGSVLLFIRTPQGIMVVTICTLLLIVNEMYRKNGKEVME